jgi:hypothetical protein
MAGRFEERNHIAGKFSTLRKIKLEREVITSRWLWKARRGLICGMLFKTETKALRLFLFFGFCSSMWDD